MRKSVTIRLPADLLAKARRKAAAEGRTLSSLVEEGLELALLGTREPKSRRTYLPVSTATGGPAPGFEHLTLSKIQEIDDLEYVERLKKAFR